MKIRLKRLIIAEKQLKELIETSLDIKKDFKLISFLDLIELICSSFIFHRFEPVVTFIEY